MKRCVITQLPEFLPARFPAIWDTRGRIDGGRFAFAQCPSKQGYSGLLADFEPSQASHLQVATCGNPRTTPNPGYALSNEYGVARVIRTGTCSANKLGHHFQEFRGDLD